MRYFRKITESAELVNGMAQRLGLGFITAPLGEADATSFRSMVLACSNCTEHSSCQSLQAANPQLQAAPEYCRNRARFAKR